jgi:branched-subunit amino acid aminotransferase/4-amino-4-deoxychorismate lyase
MLNYWGRRRHFEHAQSLVAAEILLSAEAVVLEGSRNNVLIVPAGQPRTIATPALDCGSFLNGIMRRATLDFAADRGYAIEERTIWMDEVIGAEAVFLTNSVRGVRPVDRIIGHGRDRVYDRSSQDDLIRLFREDLPRHILSLPDADEPTP